MQPSAPPVAAFRFGIFEADLLAAELRSQRLILPEAVQKPNNAINVVLNWSTELKQ